jgi:hypothetical protein
MVCTSYITLYSVMESIPCGLLSYSIFAHACKKRGKERNTQKKNPYNWYVYFESTRTRYGGANVRAATDARSCHMRTSHHRSKRSATPPTQMITTAL